MSIRIPTPEFLLWSLRKLCPIRCDLPKQQGEQVWRHLRPLQEFSLAQEQGRIFEGICVQLPANQMNESTDDRKGFRAHEMLAFYGGEAFVAHHCADCPANTAKPLFENALANCLGLLPVDVTKPGLPELFQAAVTKLELIPRVRAEFPQTAPLWYGLWCESPLHDRQLALVEQIVEGALEMATAGEQDFTMGLSRELLLFRAAICSSRANNLPLDIELFPCGVQLDKDWFVNSHCPRCKAEMKPSARSCRVCGRSGHCHPERKRRARGDRPYWPLRRFLGESGTKQFLSRYRDSQRGGS